MLGTALSADTQALLLLCSRLGLAQDVKPLSTSEWNRVAVPIGAGGLTPGALLGRSATDMARDLSVDPLFAERMARLLERGGQLALEVERLISRGIWTLSRVDEEYPARWKTRLRGAAPIVIFGAGPLASLDARAMAIVGSRDVDQSALAFTAQLAESCVGAGLTIVSGGARGSDAAAVTAALDAGGCASIVLADSLEQTLKKRELLNAIRAARLTVVTAEHPSRPFSVPVAMARNRLIYCLAEWATVVSSAVETGGTWSGAVEALRHEWVPVFVHSAEGVPDGNRELIQRGASPLRAEDVEGPEPLIRRLDTAFRPVEPELPIVRESAADGIHESAAPDTSVPVPSHDDGATDAYGLVIGSIVEYCAAPRTLEDVTAAFALERAQAKAWLARAVSERRLRKRARPVRYEATGAGGLFGGAN